jgi:hypothetical protein
MSSLTNIWVDVRYCLPELNAQVLAVTTDTKIMFAQHMIEIVNYKQSAERAGRPLWTNQCGYERRVLYWRPLPQLPEELQP